MGASIDTTAIRAQLTSTAAALGTFKQVLGHQPLSAPGSGLTFALWLGSLRPVPAASGLNRSTARIEFLARAYIPADTAPMDDVDLQLMNAVDALLTAYSAAFTLGGRVMCVDLLGAYGEPLAADYRYMDYPDSTTYRTANITIPVIVPNVWTQAS